MILRPTGLEAQETGMEPLENHEKPGKKRKKKR
jgi:hypothetical protein